MSKPLILAVECEEISLAMIQQELSKRYAADYDIVCLESPGTALQTLEELRQTGREVVAILASCWLGEMGGEEFLQRGRALHPEAKRALLVAQDDVSAAPILMRATALGTIDAFTGKPIAPADEEFRYVVSGLLRGWAWQHRPKFLMARIIGRRWSRRSHELRDIFQRNSLPYAFYDVESAEGRALLEEPDMAQPVVLLADGQVLSDPTNVELANALDVSNVTDISGVPTGEVVDVVIVGAWPAGLSAAVYGASEGLHTVVVEREVIGGQAGMSSRIRNYLGFPMGIGGGELAARAYRQAWLFGTDFTFGQEVVGLEARGDERVVLLSDGTELHTRTVVLTMGVSYRRLGIPALDELIGAGVFYGAAGAEAVAVKGQQVYVVGAGNSAGQAALHLARYARQVTMLVRGETLSTSMSEYLIKEIESTENISVRLHTQVVGGEGRYRLEELVLEDRRTGEKETVPAQALFVLIGATPHTGWLPDTIRRDSAGFILTGAELVDNGYPQRGWTPARAPLPLETSMPGIFAAGDVCQRSLKRVASAVGEGSIAITSTHRYLAQLQ